jgi:hypothetical protein
MGFNKVNFSKVSDEDLEKLQKLEIRWHETIGQTELHLLIQKEWEDFYHKKIEPFTNGVYYDKEDLENEIKMRKRNKIIDLWIEKE